MTTTINSATSTTPLAIGTDTGDGTLKIKVGNTGGSQIDGLAIDALGNLTIPGNIISGGSLTTTLGVTAGGNLAAPNLGAINLLGTLVTTSGTSQSLSGLSLTGYKTIRIFLNGVACNTSGNITTNAKSIAIYSTANAFLYGLIEIDLSTSVGYSHYASAATSKANLSGGSLQTFDSALTTASTTITISATGASMSFTGGSITIYGVK